ncbi:ParB/RepB/Spo0J family partition protein [Streptomyces sp. NPDC059900]|uniref:ParB/RepB/Spo0J family partition protein n=1 Tax=Streptomyces sp. NPDC059900 TaxID=3155816 RepID=UPI003440D547
MAATRPAPARTIAVLPADAADDKPLTGSAPRLATVHLVPLSRLQVTESPRCEGENTEHTRALAASKENLPPILVHRDTMRVIDGAHRVRAALLQGRTTIETQFFDGPADEAFILAVKANLAHGLQLTKQDRTAAAARIVATHPQCSDRAIAATTGLSVKTVSAIRRCATDDIPQLHARVGLDGRIRPLSTADGRTIAARYIASNPTASLREVAAVSGISTGTVRDVRRRLRRGDDPVPVKQRPDTEPRRPAPAQDADTNGAPRTARPAANRPSVLHVLRRDPTLRFTETGRALLRLLDSRVQATAFQEQLISGLPPTSRQAVAQAAREYSEAWLALADRIETERTQTAAEPRPAAAPHAPQP